MRIRRIKALKEVDTQAEKSEQDFFEMSRNFRSKLEELLKTHMRKYMKRLSGREAFDAKKDVIIKTLILKLYKEDNTFRYERSRNRVRNEN